MGQWLYSNHDVHVPKMIKEVLIANSNSAQRDELSVVSKRSPNRAGTVPEHDHRVARNLSGEEYGVSPAQLVVPQICYECKFHDTTKVGTCLAIEKASSATTSPATSDDVALKQKSRLWITEAINDIDDLKSILPEMEQHG